jgi:hypothetical protein
MSEEKSSTIEAKLNILIADFQRFRTEQNERWSRQVEHTRTEDVTQAEIRSIVRWHSYIGAFFITTMMSFAAFIYTNIRSVDGSITKIETRNEYMLHNRDVAIEMIEAYKQGTLCVDTPTKLERIK